MIFEDGVNNSSLRSDPTFPPYDIASPLGKRGLRGVMENRAGELSKVSPEFR